MTNLRERIKTALEALELVGSAGDGRIHFSDIASIGIAKAELRRVLEEPPRQCDVGTAEEQTERFKDLCRKYRRGPGPRANCKGCPIQHESLHVGCTFAWAQTPYKKGESDGK